jgi:predicted HicB family RNase H-like nuclease
VARQAGKQPSSAPYPIVLAHHSNGDGPEWRATVEELPGCEARGATPESAAAAIHEELARWLQTARAEGREVPPPGAAAAHSGKLLVRMPRSLHAELTRASEREGTSLNGYIVAALSASVAWRRAAGSDQRLGPAEEPAASPGLTLALKANLVVLALAAVIAIALLITAWAG